MSVPFLLHFQFFTSSLFSDIHILLHLSQPPAGQFILTLSKFFLSYTVTQRPHKSCAQPSNHDRKVTVDSKCWNQCSLLGMGKTTYFSFNRWSYLFVISCFRQSGSFGLVTRLVFHVEWSITCDVVFVCLYVREIYSFGTDFYDARVFNLPKFLLILQRWSLENNNIVSLQRNDAVGFSGRGVAHEDGKIMVFDHSWKSIFAVFVMRSECFPLSLSRHFHVSCSPQSCTTVFPVKDNEHMEVDL
ncbi:hypothetical protein CEXT_417361 [Caerostris extrusa]|uniref:Uncharacterized protein n=1 Tax=Caerostris extrusa TaxID=172846 RepID=A0AAV4N431_CAEEX|nr:hypothetical protein CEXT_417361 [Caerostris extrusa]